jgi:hypothetical protein
MSEMESAIQDAEDQTKAKVNRIRRHPSNVGCGIEFIGSKKQWVDFCRILEKSYDLFVFTSRWVEFGTGWLYDVYIGLEPFDVEWLEILG